LLITTAYLGLAVLGSGGLAAFIANPARVTLALSTFALAGAAALAGGSLSQGEREDRSNRGVIGAVGVIGVGTGYLPAHTDRHDFWTIDGDFVRWVGVILFVVGGALRLWPVYLLGNRFSGLAAIQPGHTLVTSGIYGAIRHPSYLGLLVNSLGWAFVFRAGSGLLLMARMIPQIPSAVVAAEAWGGSGDRVWVRWRIRRVPWAHLAADSWVVLAERTARIHRHPAGHCGDALRVCWRPGMAAGRNYAARGAPRVSPQICRCGCGGYPRRSAAHDCDQGTVARDDHRTCSRPAGLRGNADPISGKQQGHRQKPRYLDLANGGRRRDASGMVCEAGCRTG